METGRLSVLKEKHQQTNKQTNTSITECQTSHSTTNFMPTYITISLSLKEYKCPTFEQRVKFERK